ncbi:type II toxin-antitoxin system VapB family antitoxin [Methylobacterium sp. BTF04]|uniref:type II toxin-antitoxin system VapB family antitoxin n=1 Tax=Methylobacterium sp. BTF04 TaxID=2708300 RepID=UPI0013D1FEB8|nr:type II toxin-antitoxin system VapB family antitoxin [Methylobacterium sp. BTF04]
MAKQLNIRSDEAHALASDFADRLDTSVTEIVVRALREFGSRLPPRSDLTPSQQLEYDALRALARRAAANKLPGATSDHSDLYDEFGLPI